uniref:ATP synthase F0 subunit 8 n=1 Tax=Bothrogonia yunana TaxID=1079933 RepID=A0A7D5UFT6_9HEMI|nr:ATP synthase F0 subunit 8 [Bothrogonia yunana]QLI54103.1 ATP synthase F0 subunit 8 [Bothrogonia yunana]
MSPMWWTSLMMMFLSSLLLIMTLIYFDTESKTKNIMMFNKKSMIWKW